MRLEADDRLVSGGPGFAWRLPFGEIEGYAAGEPRRRADRWRGVALVSLRRSARQLRGLRDSARPPLRRARPLRRPGPAALEREAPSSESRSAGSRASRSSTPEPIPRDTPSSQRASIASSSSLTRDLNLFLSVARVFQGSTQGNEAYVGLSLFLGNGTTALASYGHQDGLDAGSIDVQKSLPIGTGFGYHVNGTGGEGPASATGDVQYNASFGRYEASVLRLSGETTTTLGASGGIVALGGTVLPTRPVVDSFALIRVPGVPGVHGTASNQDVGTTNASGDLLLPSLIPYYGNRIGITDRDVPLDYEIGSVERTVATPYRGGAVVEFPVRRVTTVTGRLLVVAAGAAKAPAYGELTVPARTARTRSRPWAATESFYLENLPPGRYPALVEHKEKVCRFMLVVPVSTSAFVNVGTVRCAAPEESGKNP